METRFGVASDVEGAVVDRRSIAAVEYEYEYEYCSVADLQRDHRTIGCLALTDGEISICCSVASLHPQFLGQLVQVNILCPCSPAVYDSFENMRNGGLCVSRAYSQDARFRILDARGHWISLGLKQF